MYNGYLTFLVVVLAIVPVVNCSGSKRMVENPCENIRRDGISVLENSIHKFIAKHQEEILKSTPKYQLLLKWLEQQPCIGEIFLPEGVTLTIPTRYSILAQLTTDNGVQWVCLNIQEGKINKGISDADVEENTLFLQSAKLCPEGDIAIRSFVKLLIKNTLKTRGDENFQFLPPLSKLALLGFYKEETKTPKLRSIFLQLDPENKSTEWFTSIKALEAKKAQFHLCGALMHRSYDVKIEAMKSLGRIANKEVIPYLIEIAQMNAELRKGSEEATIHKIYQQEIIKTLNTLTGRKVHHKFGAETKSLLEGIEIWKSN